MNQKDKTYNKEKIVNKYAMAKYRDTSVQKKALYAYSSHEKLNKIKGAMAQSKVTSPIKQEVAGSIPAYSFGNSSSEVERLNILYSLFPRTKNNGTMVQKKVTSILKHRTQTGKSKDSPNPIAKAITYTLFVYSSCLKKLQKIVLMVKERVTSIYDGIPPFPFVPQRKFITY